MIKLLLGTHAEVREFLIDYLEGTLPLLKRWQFYGHLLLCARCAAYLRKYDSSVKLARNYLDDPPPEELVDLTLTFLKRHMDDPKAPSPDRG